MSRTDSRTNPLRRRPSRTVAASIVAAVLLGLGFALVWAAALRLVQGSWPDFANQTASWLAALTWGSTTALLACVAVAFLGLILLVAGVTPGAPTAIPVDNGTREFGGTASTEVVMTRRSIAKLSSARALQVDGVDGVSTVVGSRQVTVAVRTPSAQRRDIEQQVSGRVVEALHRAGLTPMPSVTVNVRTHRP